MDTLVRPSNRLFVVAGIVTVLMAFTMAAILLLPGRSLAQDGGLDETAGPVPVPALNPPIQAPQPGQAAAAPIARGTDLDVEVLKFRPTEHLVRGQGTGSSPSVDKPAGGEDGDTAKPATAAGPGPQEAYSAPDYAEVLAPLDWVELLYEGFVGFSPPAVGVPFAPTRGVAPWAVYDFPTPGGVDDGLERTWGNTDWVYYYHDDDPSDMQSAWPAAFGADALDPNAWYYPNYLNSWLDYGPIDLSNMDDAIVSFGLWYRTQLDVDKIKFCVSTDGMSYGCISWSGDSGGWTDQVLSLTSYVGNAQVWLAWVFQSDGSTVSDGPFVDEISVFGHEIAAPPPPSGELIENGSFETGDLTGWQTGLVLPSGIRNGGFESGPDGSWTEFSTHGWDLIVDWFPELITPHNGNWAVWLGGEHDEVSAVTQEVTIPAGSPVLSYWHWIASSQDSCGPDFGWVKINGMYVQRFSLCASNNTGGWVRRVVDLSAYINDTVELQIGSQTDSAENSNLFIDDVRLGSTLLTWEGQEETASAPEAGAPAERKREHGRPQNAPGGDAEALGLLKAALGSNPPAPETSGEAQQASEVSLVSELLGIQGPLGTSDVGVSDMTRVEGTYAAYLWRASPGLGVDSLYQTLDVPAGATDLVLDLWFGVATWETKVGYDWICMNMADPTDHTMILVDLGCIDATDAASYWQELIYGLDPDEMAAVAGRSVDLAFYLFSDVDLQGLGGPGEGATTAWIDYVRAYATGGGGGQSLDPNEPNDDDGSATLIACGDTINTGVIGDALGGYDIDWFKLSNVPLNDVINIDIDARTQLPPSALDSVVFLYHESDLNNWVAWNDDDGVSFDSFVVFTNTVGNNANFYITVQSYSGYGSPDSFYDLTVDCAATGGAPPPPTTEPPPTDGTWTAMLYLNAEDASFAPILTQYRTDIEAFIGAKSDFLNVVILYDGPGDNNTTRYLVQPGGAYTDYTNRWPMGELNMGHPDTLENFVTWAMDEYPANYYYLAVDDHGDGAYGISWDPNSGNDQLTPPELYSALKSATQNGARKIDIFDYEACLMGLAENAYDLREWVNYVVFFEQISWGIDTYPQYFGDLARYDTSLEVGQRIVDRYYTTAYDAGFPHTISLIDTGGMAAVRDAVSSFGNQIMATDTRAQKDAINAVRGSSQAFAADMDATDPRRAEYIDLWDLADNASSMAAPQASAVKYAVDAAVVHERHASGGVGGFIWNHAGAHGLSIYYPPSKSSSAFDGYGGLYQMSQDGDWDAFLEWAVPRGLGRGMGAFRSEIRLLGGDTWVYKYIYLPAVLK